MATCDKGLPAMMMALAGTPDLPCVLVPGGVTLLPEGGEDAGRIQTIGARFADHQITVEYAAEMGCRACGTPGGGCQFLGTAATSQVVGEALGMSLTHSALAPSGHPIWLDMARRSARAAPLTRTAGSPDARHPHRAFPEQRYGGACRVWRIDQSDSSPGGGSACRRAARAREGLGGVNRRVPRLVDGLPNGPRSFATVQVFQAGGVPEVMLHLRRAGLLDTSALTVAGEPLGAMLDWWEQSERRRQWTPWSAMESIPTT